MADTVTVKNKRPKRIFGVVTDLSGTIGQGLIANNYSKTVSVEQATATDEQGHKLDIKGVTQGTSVSIDGLYVGEGIKAGERITIGDQDFLVTSNQITEANNDFKKSSIQAEGGDPDYTVIWSLDDLVSPQAD